MLCLDSLSTVPRRGEYNITPSTWVLGASKSVGLANSSSAALERRAIESETVRLQMQAKALDRTSSCVAIPRRLRHEYNDAETFVMKRRDILNDKLSG